MAKTYSEREFCKILKNNDYHRDRYNGSHTIYTNGKNTISVPQSYNKMILARLIKENKLIIT